jgi:hypothetical protein
MICEPSSREASPLRAQLLTLEAMTVELLHSRVLRHSLSATRDGVVPLLHPTVSLRALHGIE